MRRLLISAVTFCVLATPGATQEKAKVDEELTKFAGTWKVVSTSGHGKVVTAEGSTAHDGTPLWAATTFTVADGSLTTKEEPVVLPQVRGFYFAINQETRQYRLKPAKAEAKSPAAIDLIVGKDVVLKGICELKGDELKLCVVNWLSCHNQDEQLMAKAADSKERPVDFTTKAGGDHVSYVLKRVKK